MERNILLTFSKDTLAKMIVELCGSHSIVTAIIDNMAEASGMETNAVMQNKMVQELVDRAKIEYINWTSKIMAEKLTTDELIAMIQFYSSEVGQSIAGKTPMITASLVECSQQMMSWYIPEVKQALENI